MNKIHVLSLNDPEYTIIRQDKNCEGGGVLLAVSNELNFSEFSFNHTSEIEAVTASVYLGGGEAGGRKVMFSSVYRSPSAENLYLNKLIQYIERMGSSSYDVVFLDDFNLNTIKSGPDFFKTKYNTFVTYLILNSMFTNALG